MGVYEERGTMHWQQSERYLTSAYEGGGDLSPVAPAASPGSPRDCTSCRKREPPDETPQPPPEDACAGCGGRITDRYYLLALERRWHTPCLKCCECKMPLDSEQRCYARDSNIFCKNDYFSEWSQHSTMTDFCEIEVPEMWRVDPEDANPNYSAIVPEPRELEQVVTPDLENWNPNGEQDQNRLYGSKRCARCHTQISASELVMRARDLVFHVHCFSCALCSTPLNKGDTFGIRDSAVYCRLHYETMPEYGPHMAVPGPPQMCPVPYAGPAPGPHYPPYPSPEFARVDNDVPKGPFFNGSTAPPPRQKGRPRKKKPKDQEIMAANLDLNPEYLEMGFRGGAGLGSSSRTKRMRTSFKHHQLRTMKSYFAINHNPDAKDLKQLSQKTGLPKRVLQVWFQNARAKWRRMVTKQENKMSDKCSPDASLEMDMYHGPMGSIQSLPPHSPPYSVMGGPPSPNSMDCP